MKARILAAVLASTLAAQPAFALKIDLFDQGGLAEDTAAYNSFRKAADFWESLITTDTTLRIDVSFYSQGVNGPIGGTSNYYYTDNVGTIINAMGSVASSSLDATAVAHLPNASSGSIGMWKPGYTDPALGLGADPYSSVYDNDGSYNNWIYGVTWAQGKALGLVYVDSYKDGSINFNSDLNFDFDPTDGISKGAYDFTFTAFHEIGHIMGFTSGVDYYDQFAPNIYRNWNYDWIGHGMDLFRYSENGLDWSMGGDPFFSIDGGETALLGGYFSTGVNWGDGQQASHWKEGLGMMDPTSRRGEMGVVNSLDLAAFDALGWNLTLDVLANPDFRANTRLMFGVVPEPSSWAMLIAGFGFVGLMARRKRNAPTTV
ncbi:MAG: PEP-CTERM sorting domain-containing protein [Sphingomonas sp.]|nr:MAG: PEP-CTERM sorting domain-containing protein [Sphingomonas sp.]